MNIPDHIFDSLETNFWVKILKFFDVNADPDPGIFLILDPWSELSFSATLVEYGMVGKFRYFHIQFPPYLESLSSAPVIQVLSPPISSTWTRGKTRDFLFYSGNSVALGFGSPNTGNRYRSGSGPAGSERWSRSGSAKNMPIQPRSGSRNCLNFCSFATSGLNF